MTARQDQAVNGGTQILFRELTASTPANEVEQARELLLEYGRFVVAQPGAARFCFGSLKEEANCLPFSFTEQGGGCLVAQIDTVPAGFIAWRALPASTTVVPHSWELKRLWVRPAGRGHNLGFRLTQAVLHRGAASGCRAVYLDTVPNAMASAHRLYLRMGFAPCPRYNDNPVEGLAYLVKFL